jgi:SET domain-containing protein
VLFVDAAFMGSFASRMSHSCTPNCQAAVVSSKGRLTVAMYTTRRVEPVGRSSRGSRALR